MADVDPVVVDHHPADRAVDLKPGLHRAEWDAPAERVNQLKGVVPLDRDPVPTKFSELVRRYYEQLGKSE